MTLLETNCPKCHEVIQVDTSRPELFCMYCGTKFPVSDIKGFDLSAEAHTKGVKIKGPGDKTSVKVSVFIDGDLVGYVCKYDSIIVDVTPGEHTVWARSGLEGSKKVKMDLKDGDTVAVDYRGLRGYIMVKE